MTKPQYYPNTMPPSEWYKRMGEDIRQDIRAYAMESGEDDWEKALDYGIKMWRKMVVTENRPKNSTVRRVLRTED